LGVELTEEPYDGPAATALVHALMADLNQRYSAWADDDGREEHQAEGDDEYLAQLTASDVRAPNGAFVIARLDGEPVACGALRRSGRDGLGEIKRMYTVPSARRQGIAALVLEWLEDAGRRLGYRRLRLETGTAQPEAVALYERAGWQRIVPFGFYADHPASVCFGKELAST
jgi:GNAT superfamily N-acetyltransferase